MADKRKRNPEQKRRALLQAALEDFSAEGIAGARTASIARRAGVSKQLIAHYFGGKRGLYDALVDSWLDDEARFAGSDLDLPSLAALYVREGAHHRPVHRLLLRASMAGEPGPPGMVERDVKDMKSRQRSGELPADLDPAFVFLALRAIASMALIFPDDLRRLLGVDPESDEATEWHADQLEKLVRLISSEP
jgi:TetR/AcrR family transcriptional regulator